MSSSARQADAQDLERNPASWKGNSNYHGARPVHHIISMIKWTQTSRLSINNSLSGRQRPAGYELLCVAGQRGAVSYERGTPVFKGGGFVRQAEAIRS